MPAGQTTPPQPGLASTLSTHGRGRLGKVIDVVWWWIVGICSGAESVSKKAANSSTGGELIFGGWERVGRGGREWVGRGGISALGGNAVLRPGAIQRTSRRQYRDCFGLSRRPRIQANPARGHSPFLPDCTISAPFASSPQPSTRLCRLSRLVSDDSPGLSSVGRRRLSLRHVAAQPPSADRLNPAGELASASTADPAKCAATCPIGPAASWTAADDRSA